MGHGFSLSTGEVVGIIIGFVAVVGVSVALLFFLCWGSKKYCLGEFSWQKGPPVQTQQIQIVVPDGSPPGTKLTVNHNGLSIEVVVPQGAVPGQALTLTVAAAPAAAPPAPAQQVVAGTKSGAKSCAFTLTNPRVGRVAAGVCGTLALLALILFGVASVDEADMQDEHERLIQTRVNWAATDFREVGCVVIREHRRASPPAYDGHCTNTYTWDFQLIDELLYAGKNYTSRAVNIERNGNPYCQGRADYTDYGRADREGIPPLPEGLDVCNEDGVRCSTAVPCWVPRVSVGPERRWQQCHDEEQCSGHRTCREHVPLQWCDGFYQCANVDCVKLFDPHHEVLMMSDEENYYFDDERWDPETTRAEFNPFRDEHYAEFPEGFKFESKPPVGILVIAAVLLAIGCCCFASARRGARVLQQNKQDTAAEDDPSGELSMS